MKHKFEGDPKPSGKGGLQTRGETSSTKKLLAKVGSPSEKYGRKR